MIGYHFTGETLRDGRPIPPIGEWLELPNNVQIKVCPTRKETMNGFGGLHACEDPLDALLYALGSRLHHVEIAGDLAFHDNPVPTWAGRRRRILASIDAKELLLEFARWCALQVIDLWDAPVVVREFLETGDAKLRVAAGDASWSVAKDADEDTVEYAAWAAWAAAKDAAEDPIRGVAEEAARVATEKSVEAATCDTARNITRLAAQEIHRVRLRAMVDDAFLVSSE